MRESFVFHEDYICDLPADYKADFIRYTVEYGLYGIKPKIADGTLEMALWAKIARRIDAETERYQAISAKRREAASKRYAKATPSAAKIANVDFAEQKEQKQKEEQPKVAKFEKPTVEEIAAYCSERKNGIDPQAFFDFYESKGWKVGAVKMKDWRASVRTWEQRRKNEGGGRNKAGGMWGNENEIPDEITDLF